MEECRGPSCSRARGLRAARAPRCHAFDLSGRVTHTVEGGGELALCRPPVHGASGVTHQHFGWKAGESRFDGWERHV